MCGLAAIPKNTATVVVDGLRSFNRHFLGEYGVESIAVDVYNEGGEVLGGANGYIQLEWLFIDVTWIPESMRSAGIGSRVLGLLESEALGRGAQRALLDTMGFQAEDFYKRHGYAECARIENFASGFDRIYMTKSLT